MSEIKDRSEIDEKYKWNLEMIYPTTDDYLADITSIEK